MSDFFDQNTVVVMRSCEVPTEDCSRRAALHRVTEIHLDAQFTM